MNKKTLNIIVLILVLTTTAIAQNNKVREADFNKCLKELTAMLPGNWTTRTETAMPFTIIIQSPLMDLKTDIDAGDNDWGSEGQCEILIKMLPYLSPDSISYIRARNQKLKSQLPPQYSKGNLKTWQDENAATLALIDAEPTHYDDNYSYRISYQQVPKAAADRQQFDYIIKELETRFRKYIIK